MFRLETRPGFYHGSSEEMFIRNSAVRQIRCQPCVIAIYGSRAWWGHHDTIPGEILRIAVSQRGISWWRYRLMWYGRSLRRAIARLSPVPLILHFRLFGFGVNPCPKKGHFYFFSPTLLSTTILSSYTSGNWAIGYHV